MTNQSFDNEVKQKLSEHEMPVPPGTWNAIAQKKRKRRFFVFWWVTGAGILLLGIIGGRAIINDNNRKGTDAVAVNAEQEMAADSIDTGAINEKKGNNYYNDQQNSTSTVSSTTKTDTNEKGDVSDKEIPNNNTGLSNQPDPLIPREDNSNIQISPATTGKKKKKQVREINNGSTGEVVDPAILDQPASIISGDQTQSISFSSIMNRAVIDKADLMNNYPEYEMTIGELIKKTVSPDSALIDNVKESASHLLKPKRSSWMIDVAVNSFLPVRRQQSLTAITRKTINPMHIAEFRADKIKTVLQPALSYSISLRKKINNRIGIGVGMQYAVIKEVITLSGKETNTRYSVVQRLENGGGGPRLVNDTVANVTTGTRTIDAVNSYRYFNLPLSLQYMLINRHDWSLQLNGGIDIGLYTKYNNSINGPLIAENVAGPIAFKQNNTIKTGFFTGIRFSQYLNKNVQWFAEPYLRFNAGRYSNTIINNKAIHQAGIGVGLSFNIGQ